MKMRAAWVAGMLTLTGLTGLRVHHVQAAPAGEEEARKLFAEGNKSLDAGDYTTALDKFRGALTRWNNPKILINIGTTLVALGRYAEAADTYELALKHPELDKAKKPEIEKALKEAEAKSGKVKIVVSPTDAKVSVDGKALTGSPPFLVRLDPGKHAVIAEKTGLPSSTESVSIEAGKQADLSLKVKSADTASTTAPSATQAPAKPLPVEKAASSSALPWVVGGVGVASLIASGVFFGLRAGAISDLEGQCKNGLCPTSSDSTISKGNTMGTLGVTTLIVGGVGLGAGIVLLATRSSGQPTTGNNTWHAPSDIQLGVTTIPGGAGAGMGGRFLWKAVRSVCCSLWCLRHAPFPSLPTRRGSNVNNARRTPTSARATPQEERPGHRGQQGHRGQGHLVRQEPLVRQEAGLHCASPAVPHHLVWVVVRMGGQTQRPMAALMVQTVRTVVNVRTSDRATP